ncbi:MAG: hypothetical protein J2P47_08970 [Acetobacteraceae bacterium]|nr:hypothetical protein [Acetobacteraceae bacterium]
MNPVTCRHDVMPHKDVAGADEWSSKPKHRGEIPMRFSLIVAAAVFSFIAQAASAAQPMARPVQNDQTGTQLAWVDNTRAATPGDYNA